VGVVIIQLPMVPALIIFALASAIAVVLIWAKPRTDVTRLSRALAAGLTLEWVGVAAFGTYGPSVGFSYGLTSRLLTQCGVAMSLRLLVTIRSRVAPARPPRARR
jgi:hypothetical protein